MSTDLLRRVHTRLSALGAWCPGGKSRGKRGQMCNLEALEAELPGLEHHLARQAAIERLEHYGRCNLLTFNDTATDVREVLGLIEGVLGRAALRAAGEEGKA